MPTITMWASPERRCLLIVANGRYRLQLMEHEQVVRDVSQKTADAAITEANTWRADEGLPPPPAACAGPVRQPNGLAANGVPRRPTRLSMQQRSA